MLQIFVLLSLNKICGSKSTWNIFINQNRTYNFCSYRFHCNFSCCLIWSSFVGNYTFKLSHVLHCASKIQLIQFIDHVVELIEIIKETSIYSAITWLVLNLPCNEELGISAIKSEHKLFTIFEFCIIEEPLNFTISFLHFFLKPTL